MGINTLAEAIIIQSVEDLWNKRERRTSLDFFNGDGVSICAELAGMNLHDEIRLFNLVNDIMRFQKEKSSKWIPCQRNRTTVHHSTQL